MKGFCAAAKEKVEAAEGKVTHYRILLKELFFALKVDETAKMNRQLLVALKRSREKEKRLEQKKNHIEEELAQLANQLKNSRETLLMLQNEMQKKKEDALAKEAIEEEKAKATSHKNVTAIKAAGLFLSAVGLAGLGLWCLKKS